MTIARQLMSLAVTAALVIMPTAATAQDPPTDDPSLAATFAATWTARQVDASGAVAGFDGSPDVGATADAAIALAITGEGGPTFDRMTGFITANFAVYAGEVGAGNPGRLGKLLQFADAAGLDPRAFGGDGEANDLVTRVQNLRQDGGVEAGMYGDPADFNTFAQATLQSLAILGLTAHDVTPDQTAYQWLLDQQCGDGSFGNRPAAERAAEACTGSDSNTTGFAIQALATSTELATDDAISAGLDYLDSIQNDDAGLPYEPDGDSDPNSTALAIQAILAAGGDIAAAPWVESGETPMDALISFQLGCEDPSVDRGALFAPFAPRDASPFATFQGLWALGRVPFTEALEAPSGEAVTFPDCPLTVRRAAGENRYGTAADAAVTAFPDGADTVVVATGTDFADALTGTPLADVLGAPVLLTLPNSLPSVTAEAITTLGATRAVVLGGEAAVSPAVADALVSDTSVEQVERVHGQDRFATAVAISDRMADELGREHVAAIVAQGIDPERPGQGFADALGASALATTMQVPVLLTAPRVLPGPTANEIDGLEEVTIVGGTAAVSEEVAEAADTRAETVVRIGGANRYATAALLTQAALDAGADPTVTWVASGETFADALPAAAAAAATDGLLVLALPTGDAGATGDLVVDIGYGIDVLSIAGGTAALSQSTADALAAAARANAA